MPDLEEMGAEDSPAMTSHAGMETTFAEGEGSGGRASLSMLEVNDRLQHIDELVEKGVDHVQSPLRRRGGAKPR